ncbi:predicted protein [Sclerotinia sclerotiorum 1980 UF-70]|uniref:Uncharacterized protein n=1 Tax=Sclerotinia sclerotiorum (strain ATCC 18683 / 1980 / Ss-1) TaxID=665079 RepID=A7EI84_SCLS1|nr:predicted protein [Sclerotinia sclerotiorum 1980 UF-70]EDO02550.1 predicted protein [Sclerotinia sclerotiorum 1980 UF-70]
MPCKEYQDAKALGTEETRKIRAFVQWPSWSAVYRICFQTRIYLGTDIISFYPNVDISCARRSPATFAELKTNNNVADQWDWHMEGGVGNLGIAYTEPS